MVKKCYVLLLLAFTLQACETADGALQGVKSVANGVSRDIDSIRK